MPNFVVSRLVRKRASGEASPDAGWLRPYELNHQFIFSTNTLCMCAATN